MNFWSFLNSRNQMFNKTLFLILMSLTMQSIEARDSMDYAKFGAEEDYSVTLNAANRLYIELFQNRTYFKDLAPINGNLNINSTVKQRLGMTVKLQMLYIVDLDAARQMMRAFMELEIVWQDIRLAWDPNDFDGLSILWVQCDTLWVPDDFVANTLTIDEVAPDRFKQCWFYSNGTVVLDEAYNADLTCQINVGRFPFDTQVCPIQFAAPAYGWYRIDPKAELFTKYDKHMGVAQGNGEVVITKVSLQEMMINGTNSEGNMNAIGFAVEIKREPSFYIYVIVIPCFLLTFLSVIGCFWTANVKEEQLPKLSIALTSMMSMTTFVDMVSQQMPKTNHFPLLGIFVLICVFITSIGCVALVSMPEKCPNHGKPKTLTTAERIQRFLFSKHFLFLAIFQCANLVNIIVFLSFWD